MIERMSVAELHAKGLMVSSSGRIVPDEAARAMADIEAKRPKPKRPLARPEELLQRRCVKFLRGCVLPPPEGPAWTAINPVPAKSKAAAGVSKAMGLRPGVDDLMLLFLHTYWGIEFKAEDGAPSKSQREWHQALAELGFICFEVRTFERFIEVLQEIGVPFRDGVRVETVRA